MIYEPCVLICPEVIQIAKTSRIDSFTKIEGGQGVKIGEFVHIASFCHLNIGGGTLIIEDHATLSSSVRIATGTPDWSYLYVSAAEPAEHKHTKRYINRIGAYAVVFTGAVIVPGVVIGEGAVVKPGSVVYQDVAPWSIVQGNPAVKVGTRTVTSKHTTSNGVFA